jgi:hypothetical protein
MDEGLETAWAELHDANDSLHGLIGRPDYDPRLEVGWTLYAFDQLNGPRWVTDRGNGRRSG